MLVFPEMVEVSYANIAISGDIGTGKSTLVSGLVKELGWSYFSTGEYFRKWHEENNIPLEKTGDVPPKVDRAIDMDVQKKMRELDHMIFESRLAVWLAKDLPKVFKILIMADFEVAMERVSIRDKVSILEASDKSKERAKALEKKFSLLYGVSDFLDPKRANLVVDTTKKSAEETLTFVLDNLRVKF